jgi:phosphohistidine phosphatase
VELETRRPWPITSGRSPAAAGAIARCICEQAIAPELVLCSTARRARETAERIRPALGPTPVRDESELYGASAATLLGRLRSVPDGVASVLLIGHNPATAELTRDIAPPVTGGVSSRLSSPPRRSSRSPSRL